MKIQLRKLIYEPSWETTSHYNLRSEKERKSLTTDGPHVKMPCFPNIFQNGERQTYVVALVIVDVMVMV